MPNDDTRRSSILLTDILGLRFECKNEKCKSALTVSLRKYSEWEEQKRLAHSKPALIECPVCGESWAKSQPTVTEFVDVLKKLEGIVGFSLTLEVKADEQDGQKTPPAPSTV